MQDLLDRSNYTSKACSVTMRSRQAATAIPVSVHADVDHNGSILVFRLEIALSDDRDFTLQYHSGHKTYTYAINVTFET